MVVEQNPQIPDRTANLLNDETDPTMAMYATCKRLESAGANAIAIPCNTAHAFVERIQAHLRVPIVNMLTETVEAIVQRYGAAKPSGCSRRPAPSKVRFITRQLGKQGFK